MEVVGFMKRESSSKDEQVSTDLVFSLNYVLQYLCLSLTNTVHGPCNNSMCDGRI